MKLAFQSETSSIMVMSHGSETIEWNLTPLDKARKGEYDILEHINQYWAYLPVVEQDKIFEVYKKIIQAFYTIHASVPLSAELTNLVRDLMALHKQDDVKSWMFFRSQIIFPDIYQDDEERSFNSINTKDKTYLKEDYKNLICLAIGLRPLLPVWGEFIHRVGKTLGTEMKEYEAGLLLTKSGIYHCEAMEKLRIYIGSFIDEEGRARWMSILRGTGSAIFPDWLLGLVLVRRLTVCDLRGVEPRNNIVASIFKFINPKLRGQDNQYQGMIKEKRIDSGNSENRNEPSKLEGYKSKQELSQGDIEIITYYSNDPHRIARNIAPDIDLKLVDMSLKSASDLMFNVIQEPQVVLCQYVMSINKQLPPRGIQLIPKVNLIKVIAVTQALLWHRGHFELAGLVSAVATEEDEDFTIPEQPRSRITKDQTEELAKLYPYIRRSTSKQKQGKVTTVAAEAIDSLSGLFNQFNWRLTIPEEWVGKLTGHNSNRWYTAPSDVRGKLAELSIAIAKRSF